MSNSGTPLGRLPYRVKTLASSSSLACGWPPGEWLSPCEWWRLHVFRVASSSRTRNGGPNRHRNGPGRPAWADRPRPILARFDRPFALMGPLDILHFAPSNRIILTMSSSRQRWRVFLHEVWSFTLESSGMFLCNTLVLATFGSDFIMLSNTNETLHLLL
jgi:hypothetical protein